MTQQQQTTTTATATAELRGSAAGSLAAIADRRTLPSPYWKKTKARCQKMCEQKTQALSKIVRAKTTAATLLLLLVFLLLLLLLLFGDDVTAAAITVATCCCHCCGCCGCCCCFLLLVFLMLVVLVLLLLLSVCRGVKLPVRDAHSSSLARLRCVIISTGQKWPLEHWAISRLQPAVFVGILGPIFQ